MPLTSRKRKITHTDADEEAARAIFQKHFEAQFAPLPEPVKAATDDRSEEEESSEDGGEDEDEEWGGISDDEEEAVEVVDHTSKSEGSSTMGKREQKDFMSSRPPTEDRLLKKLSTPPSSHPEDSRTLLSQDLELHRLITESHLLDPSTKLHTKSFAEGRVRAKTTDLRLTSLAPGAASIHAQKAMPMGMRRGIEGAKKEREERRRREAAENGIVLERRGGKSAAKRKRGGASVDMPAIGRMRGAELSLSERDIRSVEAGSRGGSRGRGGRARGKRR